MQHANVCHFHSRQLIIIIADYKKAWKYKNALFDTKHESNKQTLQSPEVYMNEKSVIKVPGDSY